MHDDLFDGENECDPRVKQVETSIKDAEALQVLDGAEAQVDWWELNVEDEETVTSTHT